MNVFLTHRILTLQLLVLWIKHFGFLTDKQKTRTASEVGETCEGVSLESTIKTGCFFEHRRNQMICLVLFSLCFFLVIQVLAESDEYAE